MIRKNIILFLILALLCIFVIGCAQKPPETPQNSVAPVSKTIKISDLISSDEATKEAQAGLANSQAANECDIKCTVVENTWTYNYYYKIPLTKSTMTNDTIKAWEQYAENVANLAHDKMISNDMHLTFSLVFNFYSPENELLYNTSKGVST